MVRETRYLWVGNLPENIREDRIREHFKRYGRVQSVKLLPRGEVCPVDGGSSSILGEGNEGGSGSSSGGSGGGGGGGGSSTSGLCATVAFMDIKSAAKAHAIEHTLDDRVLTAQYYEPQHLQHRFPSHGSSEDHGSSGGSGGGSGGTGGVSGGGGGSGSTGSGVGGNGGGGERGERGSESFDSRGSHGSFYGSERSNRVVGTGSSGVVVGGGSGSGNGVVGGHPADSSTGDPSGYISRRPPPTGSYHVTSSRARDRLYPRTGPYVSGPPPPPHLDRHRGSLPPSSWSTYEPTSSRYGSAPPPPSPATNDSYQDEQGGGGGGGSSSTGALRQHKKQRRKSRSGSSSPSGSSRSGSSSSSRSGSSGGSTSGGSTSPGSSPHRTSNVSVMEDRRPVAICVRNLPIRSSDSSLKDGLFHEYKKHGKVTWVKVIGTASERYALVCFRKPEDVEKALEVSQDKLFFGCKIEVAPYQGYDVEDNEFRPYEAELDEYHPKATRTLFIGNLEKDVTASELRKHFEPFGEIIEIDIKKQGAVSSYAFCQYSDIGSVVKAMRSMDGEHLGANRIKLGFGKSMPTLCVWVDGIGDCTSEKFLSLQFNTFGPTTQVVVDRERGHALVFFDQISCAQAAVKEMRGVTVRGRRLQIDFASRECQETFYEHLERQGNRETSEKPWDSRPSPASSFDMTIPSRRERNSFDSATVPSSSNRFTRYDTPPRSRTTNYSRTSGGSTPGASPAHPTALSRSNRRSYQDSYYDGDYAEPASRRFRSYDEFSQGSGASHDDYQSSVLSDGKLNDDDCPPPSSRRHAVQSVVTSIDPPAPPPPLLPPPDIRHLQKERVHLLEQLEECHSSGDEVGFVSKKRAKLDNSSTTILCEDEEPEIASLLVTSHSSRKGMEFRRVSDSKVVVHHSTRRGSCEGRGPGPCKRRRDATSRHHEHHDGSRPGTPLVDERPENLIPSEPRRFRERSHEGPLSLPLPRFATQMLNNNNNTSSSNNNNGSGTRSNNASLAKIASPPCASLSTAPSPRAAPQPPASPPPRHASSSPTSSDSETAPQSPSLEERIRSLDEKYEKWSGSRALSAAGGDALAKLDASASERFRFRHKLLDLDLHEVQPSDIVKSVLAKRSVFDEDSKRLENFNEKYEPREFTGVIGVSSMIGSTAGLTSSGGSGGCTSKVCLQYPFPSHPPIQPASGTSVTSQIGINTPLSASLTPTTTMASSALKNDPRMQHNCIHPTPATPITPGTSIKTVSPELPPVSLPIGLGSGTAASNSNGSGLSSASSLVSSNGSIGNIHILGISSTHRGLSISATTASPTVTAASTDAFNSTAITTAVPVTTLSTTTSSATVSTTTMSTTGTISSMTTSSIAPLSSITSSSNSSSSSSLSASSTDLSRSRLRKETSGSNRESRDSRDAKDSRDSKHSKGKDCQRRSRKDEADIERNRKSRDEKESTNIVNDVGNTDNHSKDFKDNKELRYERKEREEKERKDKEDRDRQERRDKEDRDRQEKKEREERERREKDEERREKERLDKERQEKDRREREERERERKEREENELKEKERREKERLDRERREREEKERQERREREERERKEHEEREKKEREIRLEREKQEKERLKREREEQERREKEERDRIERERRREEKERLEREKKREKEEKERLERERRKEKEEREKMEKEKREKEEREKLEKLEREKHEKEKRREREDQERREKEKLEREKRRDREEKDKEKRERDDSRRQSTENHLHPSVTQSQNQVTPAPIPIKRRCSSQDCPTDEDASKRMKISDHRRDSKDRSRQNRRSEDRKHRNDSHRSSRESRESRDSKESGSATQDTRDGESTRENNSRDNGSKEKQRSKKNRSEKESRERSPRVSHESEKEFISRLENSLSKRNDLTLSTEQASVGSNHTRDAQHQQQQSSTLNSHSDVDDGPISTHEIQTVRNPSATDTDSDEPKKHSIFDIVDDEPAYISMYDKVKARSTKNMQKLEEEKRQVRLKDKFSQLKQSRARREEKKQSTSWDGDSVSSKALTEDEATSESDSTRTKSLSRKGSRSRIHSDTSEEEEPFNNKVRKTVKTERFLESDVDLGFADTEEKQNPLEASNAIANSVHTDIKEEPRTSDEDERISVGFRTNHPTIVINNHERDSRKKSHKKKQKRQKNSISNENNLKVEPMEALEHKTKTNLITSSNADCRPNHGTELTTVTAATTIVTTASENAEERMRADKKQRSKKDKRRDRNGEDKAKARRKRLNRQEARDSQRMEDIFGPLSDDVDDGPVNTFFSNRFSNMTSENSIYASDSDGGRSSLDMDRTRRKTEKKRRHQPEDENSVDLAEAGREIEAKLLGMPSSPKTAPVCTAEPSDHDVFRFTDDNDSVEPSTPSTAPEKIKEKKKKRKKSKEERNRKDYHHHHHHHHHHHEKSGELPYLGAESSPPRASSPLVSKTISSSLPAPRETLLSPIPKVTSASTVSSITPPVVSDIQTKSEKKKDKFIPGFGIEIDETIHENAVKSISEPDEKDSNCQSRGNREESEIPVPTTPPAQNEDKPRVAISQEETEDAVAALLEETFGASTEDFSYEGEEEETETDGITGTSAEAPQEDVEEMQQAVESLNASTVEGDADLKPDTPQSEHDLQIDTDTEEDPNYETVDLTQPPKTPDIPSFYKSPTKTLPPVLTAPEKSIEVRLTSAVVTKPQSPPSSVIAHSWTLNEHKPLESVKPVQLETTESDVDVASPERTAQVQRTSPSPPPLQYKQPMLVPCSVPITSEIPKSLSIASSRPSPITVQPLYQRLPVSPQSQMVPMRQASPKMQTTVSCSSSSNMTPLPPLVPSRIPPLVPSQSSPRISQPLSPNGQWSRNPTLSPHVPNVGKRKASPPPTKIAVCVPIPAHRPEAPVQQIYSTAATQQPVIQHASGMLAPTPGYPRGGLPPLTLNIPPRPYMPVPPLASGIQVKNSRDSSLSGKSVIETLLPVNPNEPSQRLEEPKLSPAVIPEPTNKASTSPKVPSPNQPPTYIPETAKIEINASTSSPVFGKPAYVTDSYTMSSRTQKQISVSITTDSNLLSPRQKQEVSNLQLLTTHVPRSSTPSPVIVAHGQSHLLHKSVHNLGPPNVPSPNQSLIKTVVPIVPQQITSSTPLSLPGDKSVIPQTPCQRQSPVSQGQLVKSHIPLASTESQAIITRIVSSTASSMSTPPITECLDQHIQGQQLEMEAEAQINQTVQPMQLTPPIQSTQPIEVIKQEPIDIKEEEMISETEYNITESEKLLHQPCVESDIKQEKQEIIKTEIVPKVEVVDVPIAPKLEAETLIKLEPMNEIKEEIKENDEMELEEEPVEDPLKEPNTDPLAIDSKEDPTDSKEDSDYWSAKEVNIESVIKKVDALCDGEGNDGDDEAQQTESANSDSHDTSKNESDWFDAESSIEGEGKKNFGSTADEHDETMETCENEATKSRRGRAKSRRGSRGGVTTRRGGRNASTVSHRRGGRSPRGSKHHVEKNKLPADVYEFHDDSEEDNAGRPRLILTIKSPGPNVTGPNAQPAIPVAAVKEIPPEEFVSPAANTRKSRRLAEKDGSRNTIDDVIEDVVRGSPANKGLVSGAAGNVHATRRSTRHNNAPRNTTQQSAAPLPTELRKSPRGCRKTTRRTSENNEDSGEEKAKEVTVTAPEIKEEPKPATPESPKAEEPAQTVVTSIPQKTVSLEPMTLIDPVTGMLIPMRESEEGQYIPVSTASNQVQTINRTVCESRSGGLVSTSPTNEAPRVKSEVNSPLVATESKKEAVIEHVPCQSTPTQPIQPQTSVITKPQSPTIQITSAITIAPSSTTTTTIVSTATATSVASTTTTQPMPTSSSSQMKPTSLKAHVLNMASKLMASAQQQVITKPVTPSLPNQTIVQNIVKSPAQAIQSLNLQIPPGRVVSPSLSPRAKQAAQLTPANTSVKQGQPMSPVLNNTGVSPNPKQHLLQAAKQQTSTIVNMSQKMPINMHPASVSVTRTMHQPVSQPTTLKGINGQPHPLNPKTHLLQAVVPPIVSGSSSTQPHLVNPQPISTGSARPPVPKTPATGIIEPQKVEVPMSGCIMVPTASPQSRSVPMPTYEAPLHGSTGATPPGGQYGLVPPHRSQSPPLPPPAHHHVNTSQSEVVNHYGGLTRGGELPPHYLHSQMLQYQYLRAQQEALTAPRIAYHIPGTRSPHLPLDPKLETGIEDSHSPPLELRRGTRTPQDRTTDSPQVAQVYMLHGNVRLPPPPPQYNAGSNPSLPGAPAGARAGYYEPPPAHLRSQYPMAASEAPPEMGRATTPERCRKHHVVTPPPYASQVPPQADSFQMLLQRYPVMWQGLLALKNDQAAVQMHFVFGNPNVARDSLPCNSDGSTPPLRIAQRMRLEPTQVDGVARKMQTDNEHCMLLALPCGRDEVDVLQQSKNLQAGFITYLQQKQAAGIVNIAAPGSQQPAYVVHIFPSCEFAHDNLARIAPDLFHRVGKISHLLIVIATV